MTRPLLLLCAAFALSLCGCGGGQRLPPEALAVLEKADEIVLYSLDPDKKARVEEGGLRGWKVLGETKLSEKDKAAALLALKSGIASSDGSVAGCFNPRHGISATYEGKTVELVICYECHSMEGWTDGERFIVLTAPGPEQQLDQLLKAKDVPLPKPRE